jgi:hypothetical protein
MNDARATVSRCATCGADLPGDGSPCLACAPDEAARPVAVDALPERDLREVASDPAGGCVSEEEMVVCEVEESDVSHGPLWVRVSVALVYLAVGVACAWGSVAFFDGNFTTSSDWVFGAMAIGLSLVALVGVKESLFPSKWHPE